ncbi:hypothetical protein [Aneurinibacillus migulanus]|nr:hypothetical protein [Aneurinibacillus migulanus]MED0895998.1 hypothetical protein [Aneurinibacillus migulanus]MED1616672.1 hypothetical protein [Aneurinibacillus migulanus]
MIPSLFGIILSFKRQPIALIAGYFIIFLLVLSIIGPYIAPYLFL